MGFLHFNNTKAVTTIPKIVHHTQHINVFIKAVCTVSYVCITVSNLSYLKPSPLYRTYQ